MIRPTLYIREPDEFRCRVEIQFVAEGGKLLQTKTWVLHHRDTDPVKNYLLQGGVHLTGQPLRFAEAGENYYLFVVPASSLHGDLSTAVLLGGDSELLAKQTRRFPFSFVVTAAWRQLDFQMHVTPSTP